jgi:PBSX family phage terminase large subunit
MKINHKVYKPYDKFYTTAKPKILAMSGRTTGKTYATADYIIARVANEAKCDAVVARAASESLRSTVYAVIQRRITDMGLEEFFEFSLRPMFIRNRITNNIIYFVGIDSADVNRTKGFEPHKPVGIVWVEEANQMRSQEVLDSFLFTMYRFMKEDGKLIFTLNPEILLTHWSHDYFKQMKNSDDTEYIYTTYKDIWSTLNSYVRSRIENLKVTDENYYKYWFLGENVVFKGMVFPQFDPQKHVISKQLLNQWLSGQFNLQPVYLMIGVDGATKNDITAVNPTILFNNNISVLIGQYYHDPKKDIPLAPSQQSAYIYQFLTDLYREYPDLRKVPLGFVFDSDSGSQELMLELRNNYNFNCVAVRKKDIKDDINMFRDILVRRIFYTVQIDEYKNYHRQTLEKGFPFKDEIMSYVYDSQTNDIKKDQVDHSLKSQIYVSKMLYSDNTFRYEVGLADPNKNENLFRYGNNDRYYY